MKTTHEKMGYTSIILFGINAIIGSGIFLLPNQVYSIVGTSSIFIFIFDALVVLATALCFAEAATLFKKDGGPFLYAQAAFGDFWGFEVGFVKWIANMIAWAVMSNGLATTLGTVFPALKSHLSQQLILIVLITGLTLVNLAGVNSLTWLNNISTVAKLVPLILFVVIGIFFIQGQNYVPVISPKLNFNSFGSASLVIFYAFAGFESFAVPAEDMEDPEKTLPRAIIIVMIIVPLFYLLLQIVSIGILGKNLGSFDTPIQTAMQQIMGQRGYILVVIGEIISITGISTALSFYTPRSAVILAEYQMLPKFMNNRDKKGTPYWSIIISGIITLVIALSGTFKTLVVIVVVSKFAQYIPTILSIPVLRKKYPNRKNSFKIPGGLIVPAFALIASIWLLFHASARELIWGLGGYLIAIPFYFIAKSKIKA